MIFECQIQLFHQLFVFISATVCDGFFAFPVGSIAVSHDFNSSCSEFPVEAKLIFFICYRSFTSDKTLLLLMR